MGQCVSKRSTELNDRILNCDNFCKITENNKAISTPDSVYQFYPFPNKTEQVINCPENSETFSKPDLMSEETIKIKKLGTIHKIRLFYHNMNKYKKSGSSINSGKKGGLQQGTSPSLYRINPSPVSTEIRSKKPRVPSHIVLKKSVTFSKETSKQEDNNKLNISTFSKCPKRMTNNVQVVNTTVIHNNMGNRNSTSSSLNTLERKSPKIITPSENKGQINKKVPMTISVEVNKSPLLRSRKEETEMLRRRFFNDTSSSQNSQKMVPTGIPKFQHSQNKIQPNNLLQEKISQNKYQQEKAKSVIISQNVPQQRMSNLPKPNCNQFKKSSSPNKVPNNNNEQKMIQSRLPTKMSQEGPAKPLTIRKPETTRPFYTIGLYKQNNTLGPYSNSNKTDVNKVFKIGPPPTIKDKIDKPITTKLIQTPSHNNNIPVKKTTPLSNIIQQTHPQQLLLLESDKPLDKPPQEEEDNQKEEHNILLRSSTWTKEEELNLGHENICSSISSSSQQSSMYASDNDSCYLIDDEISDQPELTLTFKQCKDSQSSSDTSSQSSLLDVDSLEDILQDEITDNVKSPPESSEKSDKKKGMKPTETQQKLRVTQIIRPINNLTHRNKSLELKQQEEEEKDKLIKELQIQVESLKQGLLVLRESLSSHCHCHSIKDNKASQTDNTFGDKAKEIKKDDPKMNTTFRISGSSSNKRSIPRALSKA